MRISDWSSDVCSSDLNNSVTQTEVMEEHWTSQLDAAALAASASNLWRPRYMSARDLRSGINYRKRNGLDASEFEEHYWGRWFYPLNVLALCLAAIPFAFGTLRSGGAGKRLFIGIVFALGLWLLQMTRSEAHMSELQSLMGISYAVLCLKKKQRK